MGEYDVYRNLDIMMMDGEPIYAPFFGILGASFAMIFSGRR